EAAGSVADQTLQPGDPWNLPLTGLFSDDGGVENLRYDLRGNPPWLTVDADGLHAAAEGKGTWAVELVASDGELEATIPFTITVANVAPTGPAGIIEEEGELDKPWNFTVPSGTFADANGDALTYSAQAWVANQGLLPDTNPTDPGGGGGTGSTGTWVDLPQFGLSFDPLTQAFTGSPEVAGTLYLRVIATDGEPDSFAIASIHLAVADPGDVPTTGIGIEDQWATISTTEWSFTFPENAFADDDGVSGLTYTFDNPGDAAWLT